MPFHFQPLLDFAYASFAALLIAAAVAFFIYFASGFAATLLLLIIFTMPYAAASFRHFR